MMQCFKTLDELWLSAVEDVLEGGMNMPSRDGPTVELLGYSARLVDPTAHFLFNPVRKLSASYGAAELLWYLSMTDDITMIKYYAPQYERFVENGIAHGAYGKRWLYGMPYVFNNVGYRFSQFHAVIELLNKKPETRQAIMTMHRPTDLLHAIAGDKKDIPCTLSLQFFLRDGFLNLITTMRSNDLWLGLPYDVFCFTSVQLLIAEALGMKVGWYQHQAGSLHLYNRNVEKAHIVSQKTYNVPDGWKYQKHSIPVFEAIPEALKQEEYNRVTRHCVGFDIEEIGEDSLLGQCIARTATKHHKPDKILLRYLGTVMTRFLTGE